MTAKEAFSMTGQKKMVVNIPVRLRDIDFMGHVNHVVYLTYFEEGRKELIRSLFGIVDPGDYNFIMAHVTCDFIQPIKISDIVSVEIWVGKIGGKSFEFNYRIFRPGDDQRESAIYAKGRSVQVYFDYKKNISIPIPEFVRERLQACCREK